MSVVLVRVDQRLLHGQVVEGWVPYLKADSVVVADDAIAADPICQIAMTAACPSKVRLTVLRVEKAADAETAGKRTLLLVGSVEALARVWRDGVRSDAVNVGNVPLIPGRTRVTPSVALSQAEMAALDEVAASGAQVEARAVPRERAVDLAGMHRAVDDVEGSGGSGTGGGPSGAPTA